MKYSVTVNWKRLLFRSFVFGTIIAGGFALGMVWSNPNVVVPIFVAFTVGLEIDTTQPAIEINREKE